MYRTVCDRPGRRTRRAPGGPPWAIRFHRTATRAITDPADPEDDENRAWSLLDDHPARFTAERETLDLVLHAAARLIDETSLADEDIGIADVLTQLATGAWARHDSGPHTKAATAFLVTEALWLIAYAAGTPGIDRDAGIIARVIDWLDASPRPLRAQILRAAATRYLD